MKKESSNECILKDSFKNLYKKTYLMKIYMKNLHDHKLEDLDDVQ